MPLQTQGYEVITAGDGFEALLALKRSLPDVIISDLSMPNMSGSSSCRLCDGVSPTIPVIVISGEFIGLTRPESVLTDAYFAKGQYAPDVLFAKILTDPAYIAQQITRMEAASSKPLEHHELSFDIKCSLLFCFQRPINSTTTTHKIRARNGYTMAT